IVSDVSLRFQITMLRQALGDGKDGARYIANIVGRGYSFVAAIARPGADAPAAAQPDPAIESGLPARGAHLARRAEDLSAIASQLRKHRFLTIVGSGGVGKTTVAVRTGHDLAADFPDAILFVDLAALSDASLVPTAIASMLGLSVRSTDPVPSLIAYL